MSSTVHERPIKPAVFHILLALASGDLHGLPEPAIIPARGSRVQVLTGRHCRPTPAISRKSC